VQRVGSSLSGSVTLFPGKTPNNGKARPLALAYDKSFPYLAGLGFGMLA
jgi:hypothetical protein